ncbi:hypothetical protein MED217_09547, partial [Leeuwenhoekiella blandensis MED217]
MKNLGIWNKFVFFINSIFAFFLLVGYILPYYPPKIFPPISVLTLVIPVLIAVNVLFVIYWIFLLKRQVLLSLIVLGLWFFHHTTLYKPGGGKLPAEVVKSENQIRLFSY